MTQEFFTIPSACIRSYVRARERSCLRGQVRNSAYVRVRACANIPHPELCGRDPINMEIRIYGYLTCVQISDFYSSEKNHVFITVSPLFSRVFPFFTTFAHYFSLHFHIVSSKLADGRLQPSDDGNFDLMESEDERLLNLRRGEINCI